MSVSTGVKKYDMVFVGTGMICVLEAVYQSRLGKSVLMIDRQHDMGGAWLSLEIFGLHDVENAIHYFLPDPCAFDFMRDTLGWDVITSPRKFQVFPSLGRAYWRLPYDNALARFVGKITGGALYGKRREFFRRLFRAIREVWSRQPSRYVRGGVPEMLRSVKAILTASDVEVRYSTSIEAIHIDPRTATVEIHAGAQQILAKTIVFSHGSRIANLTSSRGTVPIVEKLHPRPAVHLLVKDETPAAMHECVLTMDPLIKYVHDVTRFTRESEQLFGRKKVLVLALHKDVEPSEAVYAEIFTRLKRIGMVGPRATLESHNWWAAFLPTLEDADLDRLKTEFGPHVEILRTENFARGVGYHARRWAEKIDRPAGTHVPAHQSPAAARGGRNRQALRT